MAWMLSLPLKSSKIVPLYSEKEVEKWPNHLEGVRLERDGEINANFRKEVIIGDSPPFEDPKALLEDIFHKADIDGNKLLSIQELSDWINKKIQEHINEALRENFGLFVAIDNNPRNDEILTEDEFSSLQTEGDGEKEGETLTQGEDERRKEFRDVIDRNHDGKADRKELLMYIDPKNPRHAREEAETLLVLSDVDHDGNLSLREIFNKMDLFLGSKMVDTARSFHDEF
ncbi:hypothetical protein C0J52_28038 [Blattella germanica]|nr:hypothetical protein C0J52_28038 [Blattella germanica]